MSNTIIGWGAGAAVILTIGRLFGLKAIILIVMLTLFFILPFYILYSAFGFKGDESFFFGGFTGLAFFPLTLWYLGILTGSFRLGMWLAFLLLMTVSVFIYYKKKHSFPIMDSFLSTVSKNK